jgi:acetolactate synthase I/II/III large subunit
VSVADAVAETLARLGVDHVFGLVGSSNFLLTNALVARGARFVSSRHEAGAVSMADGFRRVSDRMPVVSLHHGNGLTNALTPLVEAVKSNTPMLVLVPEARRSGKDLSFWVDQEALVRASGAEFHAITSPANAVRETARAFRRAAADGATVVLNLPLEVLEAAAAAEGFEPTAAVRRPAAPDDAVASLVALLRDARRPVLIGGRGARGSGPLLRELAAATGALLATSQGARGLFAGDPWDLDVSGGFSTPETTRLIADADLVVAWGASLNVWTMRDGEIIGADATLVQIDRDSSALDRQPRVDVRVQADVAETARAVLARVVADAEPRYRTPEVGARIAVGAHWVDVPYDDLGGDDTIDPRTLSLRLDALLPAERVICTDIGNHSSYPMLFLRVPDAQGLCAPIGFVAVGLGLASAIGAAVARPDRQVMAGIGDGGFFMSAAELETVVREKLPLLVVVYDDHAYGAETLQFGPQGHALDTVDFPDADLAAVARGFGWDAVTVRRPADLDAVEAWLGGPRERPMLVDAKIASFGSWVGAHMAAIYGGH